MKLRQIAACFVLLHSVQCHVTNRTKSPNVSSSENDAQSSEKEIKHDRGKVQESHVYLEDVVYGLKNQNWTGDDEVCLNRTLVLLSGLQNFTLWSVWSWDSIASQPQGLLFGNQYQFGNFDECMSPPWKMTHPELKTQYCVADITLERTDNARRRREMTVFDPYQSALDYIQYDSLHKRPLNQLTWGICVPAACNPHSVERLLHIMLARSHLGTAGIRPKIVSDELCQLGEEDVKFDAAFYGFIVLLATLAVISLVCTYLNQRSPRVTNSRCGQGLLKAFCLKENSSRLLYVKKEGTESLYGIRFLTICCIVMDHQLGIFNGGPVSNGSEVDQDILSTTGMFFIHNDLFVDTFFVLSGFLMASVLKKAGLKVQPLVYIFKRYSRLIISFAIVIFYQAAVFPYTGSGPLWPRAVAAEAGPCRRNWWLGLLMLNNYVNSEDICMVVSWYIPCDFHFSVAAILLFWLYLRYRGPVKIMVVALAIASLVIPAFVNYTYDLPAIQLFTYEFIHNPRGLKQFHLTYIKSHTRFAAYLIGFLTGYFYCVMRKDNDRRFSKKWSITIFIFCVVVMAVVMCSGSIYLFRHEKVESAIYAALNRPLWAAAVSGMVVCLCAGDVPLVNGFLSWYPFVPLSRLAYGVYLTHTLFIVRNVFSVRNSQNNDYVNQIITTLGVIVCCLFFAYLLWLLAEAPFGNLINMMLSPSAKRSKQASTEERGIEDPSTRNSSLNNVASTSGHLQDNLPNTIQYSSKF